MPLQAADLAGHTSRKRPDTPTHTPTWPLVQDLQRQLDTARAALAKGPNTAGDQAYDSMSTHGSQTDRRMGGCACRLLCSAHLLGYVQFALAGFYAVRACWI